MPRARSRENGQQVRRDDGMPRRLRVRSADALSPQRHHENLLLQPRRRSAGNLLTPLPVVTVRPGMVVDPDDPGRLISSAGSTRSLPSGTCSLNPKLLALLDEHHLMAEQEEIGIGEEEQRPCTPLTWGPVELGAHMVRRRHTAKLPNSKTVVDRPQSAIEVAESALDGTYRKSTTRGRYNATNPPSVSTDAPPESEVAKRVHDVYHSAKGKFNEVDLDAELRETEYKGTWISHRYVPTKRGNQRRAGMTDTTMAAGAMAEMMAAAVKAQREEEDLEYKTGMNKEEREVAAKRHRRLQRERQHAQRAWRRKRLEDNLGEGMVGEWRPGIEHEAKAPPRKPLRAARLAARDRRRAKQTSLLKLLSAQVGRMVARAVSR